MICPTCHTRLKKTCPACGRLLHLRWNLCPYCGAVQTAVRAVPTPTQPFSIAVEGAGEAPRISEARRSALSEPAAESGSEPYAGAEEPAGWAGSEPYAETEEPMDWAGSESYTERDEPEENEEEAPPSEPGWETGNDTLPFAVE